MEQLLLEALLRKVHAEQAHSGTGGQGEELEVTQPRRLFFVGSFLKNENISTGMLGEIVKQFGCWFVSKIWR